MLHPAPVAFFSLSPCSAFYALLIGALSHRLGVSSTLRSLCLNPLTQPMLSWAILFFFLHSTHSDKCYSCSSPQLHMRWPKDEETNKLHFLTEFPWYANESCDQVRNLIPVVDCPGSVCIKAVIKEPPAKRDVCVQGGAVVRDCWSRVMRTTEEKFALNPKARKNMVRLAEDEYSEKTFGVIYTCEGFLCNQSPYYVTLIFFFMIFYTVAH